MVAVLAGVVGVIIGALVMRVWGQQNTSALREEAAVLRNGEEGRQREITDLKVQLERQQTDHASQLQNLKDTFQSMSQETLDKVVQRYNENQQEVMAQRESRLDQQMEPLRAMLEKYEANLDQFKVSSASALSTVQARASELLEAQRVTQNETKRLNQLLGRGDQRGRWGEVQLQNILEVAGLRQNVDYDLQVSGANDSGVAGRPDCVVNIPNGTSIAIDAKFPYDAFEKGMASDDADLRNEFFAKHAADLRGHIKKLRSKSYWEIVKPAPEFVVLFVPSDYALSAAFDADSSLLDYAMEQRVIIAGPSNLLSLLWSVVMVINQHRIAENSEAVMDLASKLYDRIRNVADPMMKLGQSLDDSFKHYNAAVSSMESRLFTTARQLRAHGVKASKELPKFEEQKHLLNKVTPERWGIDDLEALPSSSSEIWDIDPVEDAE